MRTLSTPLLRILITIVLFQGAFAAAEPFRSFLRQASTTRRTGPAPQAEKPQPSGVLGAPGVFPAGQSQVPPDQPSGQPARTPRPNLKEILREGRGGLNPKFRERLKKLREEEGLADQEADTLAPQPSVQPRSEAAIKQGGTGVTLTFKNASIDEVVDVIMKELGHSYILDPQVAGTVNLFTHQEFPKDKLFGILEQLLKMNGQAIIRQDDLYVILPIGQSATIPGTILKRPNSPRPEPESKPVQGRPQQPPSPPPGAGPGNPAAAAIAQQPETPQPTTITVGEQASESEQLQGEEGVITYIVPLHYIPSADMVTMIKAFVSDGAQVVDFQSANILIITDYRANITQALEIIRLLDTEYFEVNTVDLVSVRYHQAVDVAEDLAQVFAPGEKAGGVRIVAIERLNSILVVTHAPEVFAEVVAWIEKLDAPSGGSNIRTFVYEVQNSTAANIAEILSQLYSDGAGLPSGGGTAEKQEGQQQARQQRERERVREESTFLQEPGRLGGSGGLPLGPSLGGRAASSGVRAAVVAGDVKIIVNEFNNSLIIQGTEADYQFLNQTIELLDVLPRQVLIEAKIYAVELRNDLSFGLSWFLQNRLPDLGHPTTGSITRVGEEGGGGISAATRIFIGGSRQLDIVIDALRTRTNVELLEAPTLLVVDGTEAQINVGAEVPVTTASFGDPLRSGSSTSFVNSISFRPTGTTLLIMPRTSASGIVTMDLAIEVSNATGPALTPTINRNFVRTSLIVRDQQQIGIAGIISDSYDVSSDRMPLLGDIPWVGALFGQTTKNRRRFELLFLITPYVIRNLPTAGELTLEFRRALRNAYGFIEKKEIEERELKDRRRQEEKLKTETNR